MVNFTKPLEIGNFHKGFTHLALWTSVKQAAAPKARSLPKKKSYTQ
ncbi:MAG: hypothetical protein F6J98_20085 [Moorea sp. SIO4G2]|nr:hypothetical protein [Moorena sp. SIO4A1]NEO46018.1 hypothetical protein [Moorena sp. SIO4A3]NEO62607.1 hypothetical protein [Moorena sp. SIO4G2]NEQ63348.1 hypothetical protein [Moorena sp. SIO4A1]